MSGRIEERREVGAGLDAATEKNLLGPREAAGKFWWEEHGRTSSEGYARVIHHANSHVRQIWVLRAGMGLTEKGTHGWPQQHYH